MPGLTMQKFREAIVRFNNHATDMWNERNLERFCEGYDEDAVYVCGGEIVRGREHILDCYKKAYANELSMGKLSLRIHDLRFVSVSSDDVVTMAVAILRWRTNGTNGKKENGYSMVTYRVTERGLEVVQDVST